MRTNTLQQNIPSGWKVLPIGKHIKLQGGNAFSASNYVSGGIPLVRIGNVGKGDFVASNFVYISEDEHDSNESVHLRENDILMGMTGELGKVARIGKQHLPAILNQRVGRVVFKDKDLNPDYTFQIFLSKDFKSKLEKYFIGAAQKNISSSQVESIEVLLPPIKEQQKIAEILGTVDEDIAKTQEVIKATEKLKRGLVQQLFTRGIGHTKFKETKIGQIPEEWDVVSLGDVTEFIDYRGKTPQKTKSGIPLITAKNVRQGYISIEPREYIAESDYDGWMTRGIPKIGDVLFTTEAPLGYVAQIDTEQKIALAQRIITIQSNVFDHTYLKYMLMSPVIYGEIQAHGTGGTVKGIKASTLRKIEVFKPSKTEQKEIAQILSAVDEKILVNKKLKEKLTFLKKGLMQDLLSGKVRTIIN